MNTANPKPHRFAHGFPYSLEHCGHRENDVHRLRFEDRNGLLDDMFQVTIRCETPSFELSQPTRVEVDGKRGMTARCDGDGLRGPADNVRPGGPGV